MALTQVQQNTPGKTYYLRKRSQGEGHKEALLDGGLIAETKVRLVKKGTAGGQINTKLLTGTLERGSENEHLRTMSYPHEAQFQQLLAAAATDPDRLAWIEVVDP
jgi:hypothetical protein